MEEPERSGTSTGRAISTVAAAWVLSLGVDLLIHGALLARLYSEPSPFLLDAHEAFRRIPFGYLTFLEAVREVEARAARRAGAGLRYHHW
jgi:hypothetical protein